MSKLGPIILVDDDHDDCELILASLQQLNIENRFICFSNGFDALDHLKMSAEVPFIILSDINMPGMDGMEFRRQIEADETLKRKSIPFIFLTTTAGPQAIKEAYELSVQGFFEKGSNLQYLRQLLQEIYNYWQRCKHPNS
jgi:CheY-like chemotaxis protein